jgi:hypothetical protein
LFPGNVSCDVRRTDLTDAWAARYTGLESKLRIF